MIMSTMNVLAIATEDKYTAAIVYDDDPGYDPRDLDDLGTMVCWHRRYKLGDNNPFKTPQDFFHAKITDLCSRDEIFDYALKAEGSVKIEKCKNGYGDNAYELFYYGYKSWLGERHEPEPADLYQQRKNHLSKGRKGISRVHGDQSGYADGARGRIERIDVFQLYAVPHAARQHQQRRAEQNHERKAQRYQSRRRLYLKEPFHSTLSPFMR